MSKKKKKFPTSFYQKTEPPKPKPNREIINSSILKLQQTVFDVPNLKKKNILLKVIKSFYTSIDLAFSALNSAYKQKRKQDYTTALENAQNCSEQLSTASEQLNEIRRICPLTLNISKKECFIALCDQLDLLCTANNNLKLQIQLIQSTPNFLPSLEQSTK